MTWYLDGNNIIGRPPGAREGGRELLLSRLLACTLPSPCVLVFDGPAPGPARTGSKGKLAVVYSGARSADDVILARVRPGDRVVTDDRDLALRSRDRQARAVSPADFLRGLKPSRAREAGEKPSPTAVDVDAWLQIFGSGDPGSTSE